MANAFKNSVRSNTRIEQCQDNPGCQRAFRLARNMSWKAAQDLSAVMSNSRTAAEYIYQHEKRCRAGAWNCRSSVLFRKRQLPQPQAERRQTRSRPEHARKLWFLPPGSSLSNQCCTRERLTGRIIWSASIKNHHCSGGTLIVIHTIHLSV